MKFPDPVPCFFLAQEWRTRRWVLGYVSPSGRRYTLPDRCASYTQAFSRLMGRRTRSGNAAWPVVSRFPEEAACGAESMVLRAFAGEVSDV